MAQIFKAKTLVSNSGRFAYEVIAPNLVYNTGDQNVSGVKNFGSRPTVNGTGVLLIGEASAITLPSTIVYTTGNQIISGNKTFVNNVAISGTGIFSSVKVSNIDKLLLSGIDVVISGNSSVNVYNQIYISGNPVLTGVIPTSQTISNVVYTTGDQNISGAKNFYTRPTVNGTGVLLSGDIPYIQTNSYFYVDATRTDSYIENGNILYPYKTLSSAYNAAKNIAYFHNPTYITLLSPIAENLTIDKGYINLIGNNTNKNDPIRITGSLVFAATGIGSTITDNNFSIAGLGVTATSNNKCILFSGNNPQRLFIQDCWLIAKDDGTCLYSNNTNTTSRLQGDILKLSPEGVNTTAIDIVSGTSSISFAETSSSASVLAYVRNNSTLNISNSQIETTGAKAFQVENAARLTLLNSVLTNTANPSTGIFLKDASSTAVVVGSAISVPANANSYAINGVANSYLFYKNLYFSIDAFGQSTESKIGNNVNKNLINSYDPVVYSIGNQTISGIKTFDVFPIISGNKLITGVDLNAYATVANLFATGFNLDNKINSLSGYVDSKDIIFSGQIALTGSNLYNSILSLSGLFTGYTGNLDTNFASDSQLFATGSTLDNKINSLSGYVNSQDITFSGQIFNTGSRLDNKINSLSGYLNAQDIVFSGQTFNTGSRLDNKINSLSGYVDSKSITLPSTIVYTTGDQAISGFKNFRNGFYLNNTNNEEIGGTLFEGNISGISLSTFQNPTDIKIKNIFVGGNFEDVISIRNSYYTDTIFGPSINTAIDGDQIVIYQTGSIYGISNSKGPYIRLGENNIISEKRASKLGVGTLFPIEKVHISGGNLRVDGNIYISGNQVLTGSFATIANLDNKINALSGVSVLTFGDQIISGNKTFVNNIGVSGTGVFNAIDLNNVDILSISGVDVSIVNGNVSLTNRPTVNGTGVVLSGELERIIINSGALLNEKINSLSGYVNSQDIVFSGQTFNTGSRLDSKINSLSGYIDSRDILFSGQISLTGSNLNDKITSLSGYVNSQDIIFSGQISSTGSILDNKINSLSGYINSQDNVFSGQIFNTGSRLDSKINSLSGYLNSQDIIFSGQIASTGSSLYNSILSLSGLFTGYTGNLDANFATDAQLFSTGSILDNKVNALSGYVNSQDNIFSGQTFNTGSRLDNKINSLSGYVNSQDIIFSGQIASTGSILDNKINALSGSFGNNIVYTTGNQIISGIKTFVDNTVFGDPSQGDFLVISGNTFTIYGSGNFTNGLFVSGVPVLTGLPNWYATSTDLALTGSILNDKINALSGYVNSQDTIFSGQTFNTGSRLDSKINSLSGWSASSGNLFSTGSNLDNKINSLSGYVNAQNIVFSGQTFNTGSRLDNKINSLSGYINSTGSNILFTTGNQTIDGNKSFTESSVLTVKTISGFKGNNIYSLNLFGANDTSTANPSIFVGGSINLIGGTGTTFGNPNYGSINLLAGGPKYNGNINLNGNINFNNDTTSTLGSRTISFYKTGLSFGSPQSISVITINNSAFSINDPAGSADGGIGFYISGVGVTPALYANINNLASTGSTLNNKINNLSGFINDNVVFKTGNQTILGEKTFSGTTTVIGHFAATSKSFLIDHPLDNNKKLQYASLEGPEHGVFLRGKTNENIINLPNYWSALVDENTISVNLTPINVYSNIYVVDYNNRRVITNGNNGNYYFYTIYGERKDIPKLTVEF